jgi:hypothetical protein
LNILYKLKASANIITKIFSIIVALSIEHKKGYLTLSNLEYIKDVKKLNNSYPLYKNITINDEESNEEEIETYIDKFSKKYLEEYHIEYNPIISIIDYITTGFLDEVMLKKELILFYNLDQTLLDKKIIQIRDFKYYSQNKLDKNIDYIFQNLNNFEMIDSLELYSKLIFLKEEVYKDKWKYNDIHERFQIYLKQQTDFKISNDKLFAVILPIKNHDLNYCFKNNLECEKYLEMLNSKYRQIIFKKKKELYSKLFNSIINNENNDFSYYRNKIENFDIDHLFENFVKFDLLDVIPKVNYMLISIFKSFLHYNILRITNAGEYYYSEKKPLQKIKKSFELVDISDVVLQFQINQLILEFNNAILHLEKTKK